MVVAAGERGRLSGFVTVSFCSCSCLSRMKEADLYHICVFCEINTFLRGQLTNNGNENRNLCDSAAKPKSPAGFWKDSGWFKAKYGRVKKGLLSSSPNKVESSSVILDDRHVIRQQRSTVQSFQYFFCNLITLLKVNGTLLCNEFELIKNNYFKT